MIVKNEEKTIARALECLKDAMFEQIVVDTGSTDRTAEIAKDLGATVYSFEWCDDFSVAKNYAIEKASGDWILFSDADEYFLLEDATKIRPFLEGIDGDSASSARTLAVSLMCVNLDDRGRPMTKAEIVRIFRNTPAVRYEGRIHEQLSINEENILNAENIEFMHTGYGETAHNEKGKADRNILLLREELSHNPNNLTLKAYLAESLSTKDDDKSQKEAAKLFNEVISTKAGELVNNVLRVKAFTFFIIKYMKEKSELETCEKMCRRALDVYPDAMDFLYYLGRVLLLQGKYEEAWSVLKRCEEILVSGSGGESSQDAQLAARSQRKAQRRNNANAKTKNSDASIMINADPLTLFCQMIITAQAMGDLENMVLYSLHVLSFDRTRSSVLGPCIANLVYHNIDYGQIVELLSNAYDFSNEDDVAFVAEVARSKGATAFAEALSK